MWNEQPLMGASWLAWMFPSQDWSRLLPDIIINTKKGFKFSLLMQAMQI